jgi:hypothetical protein
LQHVRSQGPLLEALPEEGIPDVGTSTPISERIDLDAALGLLAPAVRVCVVLA